MSSSMLPPKRGSDRLPALAHASVGDVMHPGIVSCSPDAPLEDVARLMVNHHIHSVVVSGVFRTRHGERLGWGVISSLDLVGAALPTPETATAGDIAGTEVVTVEADEGLEQAARLMIDHQLPHLLVIDAPRGEPIGILSSLDIAGAVAWGEV